MFQLSVIHSLFHSFATLTPSLQWHQLNGFLWCRSMCWCLAGGDVCRLTRLGTHFFVSQVHFKDVKEQETLEKEIFTVFRVDRCQCFWSIFTFLSVANCVQTKHGSEAFFNHKCDLNHLRKPHLSVVRGTVASTLYSFTAELAPCLLHKHLSVDGKTEQTLNVAKGMLNTADVTVAAFDSERKGCSPDTALALSRFTVSFITFLHCP